MIGPLSFSIVERSEFQDDKGVELDGDINYAAQQIQLRAGLSDQYRLVVLWHEILHAILIQSGHLEEAGDEGLIWALAYGIHGVCYKECNANSRPGNPSSV